MMGDASPQDNLFHAVTLEQLVPQDHPLRKIHPLIDTRGDFGKEEGRAYALR